GGGAGRKRAFGRTRCKNPPIDARGKDPSLPDPSPCHVSDPPSGRENPEAEFIDDSSINQEPSRSETGSTPPSEESLTGPGDQAESNHHGERHTAREHGGSPHSDSPSHVRPAGIAIRPRWWLLALSLPLLRPVGRLLGGAT